MPLPAIYSTIAADAIARHVEAAYDIGVIAGCTLLNRGFNDLYELSGADGRRHVARLSGPRFRGPANMAYETAFLAHLRRSGVAVASAIPSRVGPLWTELDAPEGPRAFALFEYLDGAAPVRTLWLTGKLKPGLEDEIRLLGESCAAIHAAAETYRGPSSLYRLDADHLLRRPLTEVFAAPVTDAPMAATIDEIRATLDERLSVLAPKLSIVGCHGDNHGGNTFIVRPAAGSPVAAWFDFDDAGPGYLAYDLATFRWGLLRRVRKATLDEIGAALWSAFLGGYQAVRPIPDADFAAIDLFVPIRQAWYLGECAAHIPLWGTETVSRRWLEDELAMMKAWAETTAADAG
ncbi:MAG TPA: phosphotransferase [Caulobacteraceae bacterium]